MTHYLKNLNNMQREAVEHRRGPLLIIAGAGTGKTRAITCRICHLIKQGVPPENILAVTFTNKAADEMRARVREMIGDRYGQVGGPFIGTFHALGVFILRNHGRALGVRKRFTIKDREDSLALIREAVKESGLDPKQWSPRRFRAIISREKGELQTYETYRENAGGHHIKAIAADIWETYEKLLARERALDFDDLLLKAVFLLREHRAIRDLYAGRWRHVHIDEYQDTNTAQYTLSRLLAAKHKNICVVGDVDQNIYSWRGADFRNMLRFEKDYPDACVINLLENYRSTKTIIEAANSVIAKNEFRPPKDLFTKRGVGEKIALFPALNEMNEAEHVIGRAQELMRSGAVPEDIAVLYRANFQSRILEEICLREKVPYLVIGTRFFERREIKDVLAYIQASLEPDNLSAIKRIINTPLRGIGRVSVVKLFSGKKSELPETMRDKIGSFYALLARIRAFGENNPPSELVAYIMKETGLETALAREGEDGEERIENIRELATLAAKYPILAPDAAPSEHVQKLLEDAALAADQDDLLSGGGGIRLMTVHAAKGLEFPYVFIAGLEQGLFPHDSFDANETDVGESDDREEERRLFYVAVTRAGKKLFLSYAEARTIFGKTQYNIPSEFLSDIPAELIEAANPAEGSVILID